MDKWTLCVKKEKRIESDIACGMGDLVMRKGWFGGLVCWTKNKKMAMTC